MSIHYKLYKTRFSFFILNVFSYFMTKLNMSFSIVNKISITDNRDKNIIYIIPFCHTIKYLPNNYICYQMEQVGHSKCFTTEYLIKILNSIKCWDYSQVNINRFQSTIQPKIVYFPIPLCILSDKTIPTPVDVLFYGIENKRRTDIMNYLINKYKNKYNIIYPKNVYNEPLFNIIKQSKIIINLNYYHNANVATYRINESLSHCKPIISEVGHIQDIQNEQFYNNAVIFIEQIGINLSKIQILCDYIEYFLDNPDVYSNKQTEIKTFIKNKENYFIEQFQKHLK